MRGNGNDCSRYSTVASWLRYIISTLSNRIFGVRGRGTEYLELNGPCGMRYVFICGLAINAPKQICKSYHMNTPSPDAALNAESPTDAVAAPSSANAVFRLCIIVCGNVIFP